MKCDFCPSPVETARHGAGLTSCRACGDVAARLDLAAKHAQVAPAFNKGAPQFVGGASFKSNALDAGRKTTAVVLDAIPDVARPAPKPNRVRRRRVGTMWTADGDCFVLYEGDDPQKRGAVRFVYQ